MVFIKEKLYYFQYFSVKKQERLSLRLSLSFNCIIDF